MTITPLDFAAITGLRVGGDPIPFDSELYKGQKALEFYLGPRFRATDAMVKYSQFEKGYWDRTPKDDKEVAQMDRAYLLYLFGASMFPNRRNGVHLGALEAGENESEAATGASGSGGSRRGGASSRRWSIRGRGTGRVVEARHTFPEVSRVVSVVTRGGIEGEIAIPSHSASINLPEAKLHREVVSGGEVEEVERPAVREVVKNQLAGKVSRQPRGGATQRARTKNVGGSPSQVQSPPMSGRVLRETRARPAAMVERGGDDEEEEEGNSLSSSLVSDPGYRRPPGERSDNDDDDGNDTTSQFEIRGRPQKKARR
ncbi:hypothetical protein RHMOL_Rhmol03G0135600 [Rhododendron molle]|uniref:Uncharacterized protein n=1 Tax=Rhododendron molle TaxID=49168 RepID=A0ACC0PDL5_RHOML|nr:hypothetical protein RHMOL_Rhmol03G0135600 [Rhododendron molle]